MLSFVSNMRYQTIGPNYAKFSQLLCRRKVKNVVIRMSDSLNASRQEVMKILVRDLTKQYDTPLDLDWSIYDEKVSFDDPATKIYGKLNYMVCSYIALVYVK